MKILLVDDSTTMRKILINILATGGMCDVLEASDGQQAVDVVMKNDDLGLVLMDWNMPIMLGIDALKLTRAAGKTVPVIMVTTEAEQARVLEALKAGATISSSSRSCPRPSSPRSRKLCPRAELVAMPFGKH